MKELTWDSIAMVIGIAALAAGSNTEIIKKAIQQGIIDRTGKKPWWRGTVLRLCSVVSGAVFGWVMMAEDIRLGLVLGIGSGSVTSETVGVVKRVIAKKRNGGTPIPAEPKTRTASRKSTATDFPPDDGTTEFRPAIREEDL